MKEKFILDYFYGKEADQFTFFTLPKVLFSDERYVDLATDAKVLYSMMLDRMSLSIANNWFDEQGRAYIHFSVDYAVEKLRCGRNKAMNNIKSLEEYGLIERVKHGQGKCSTIYVKKFILVTEEDEEDDIEEDVEEEMIVSQSEKMAADGPAEAAENPVQKFENEISEEKDTVQKFENQTSENSDFSQKFKNQTSRGLNFKLQEVPFSNPNNTEINKNKYNIKSNHIVSGDNYVRKETRYESDETDTNHEREYSALIRENIDLELLMQSHPGDSDMIQGIYELILETVLCRNDRILIASNWYSADLVKSKFLKLNSSHIEYVLECLRKNTSKVLNIKKYLLAAIFNAPSTMSGYYAARVNYDFPQYAG